MKDERGLLSTYEKKKKSRKLSRWSRIILQYYFHLHLKQPEFKSTSKSYNSMLTCLQQGGRNFTNSISFKTGFSIKEPLLEMFDNHIFLEYIWHLQLLVFQVFLSPCFLDLITTSDCHSSRCRTSQTFSMNAGLGFIESISFGGIFFGSYTF